MAAAKSGNAAGFALIDVLFTMGILATLLVLAMPRLALARQSAGAASAIGSMRAISSAQLGFALTCGGGFYAPNLPTLGTPPPAGITGFISPQLAVANQVARAGYLIQMAATPYAPAPPSCNGLGVGQAGQAFKAAADPLEPGNERFFAINANGQIWEHTESLYEDMPEVGEPETGRVLNNNR